MKVNKFYNFAIHEETEIGPKPEMFYVSQWNKPEIELVNGKFLRLHACLNEKKELVNKWELQALSRCFKKTETILLLTDEDYYDENKEVLNCSKKLSEPFDNIYVLKDEGWYEINGQKIYYIKNKNFWKKIKKQSFTADDYLITNMELKPNALFKLRWKLCKINIDIENFSWQNKSLYYKGYDSRGNKLDKNVVDYDPITGKPVLFQQYYEVY